jgi:hypothetical protein
VNDGKCVGRPIGWQGGEAAYCGEPVKIGNRFCYRCHLLKIDYVNRRVEGLRRQLQLAEEELSMLVHTAREAEQ